MENGRVRWGKSTNSTEWRTSKKRTTKRNEIYFERSESCNRKEYDLRFVLVVKKGFGVINSERIGPVIAV